MFLNAIAKLSFAVVSRFLQENWSIPTHSEIFCSITSVQQIIQIIGHGGSSPLMQVKLSFICMLFYLRLRIQCAIRKFFSL